MTLATTRAAGFFRFPGRVTPKITLRSSGVRKVERSGEASAMASFCLRHVEIEEKPASALPPTVPTPQGTPTPRITVRV